MFRELGPDARGLLEVVATSDVFFVDTLWKECCFHMVSAKKTNWLSATISDRSNKCDTFCILSLTYRSDGYITMLAPLLDYLCSKDPTSSPLLVTIKVRYFTRSLDTIEPGDSLLVSDVMKFKVYVDAQCRKLLQHHRGSFCDCSRFWGCELPSTTYYTCPRWQSKPSTFSSTSSDTSLPESRKRCMYNWRIPYI